MNSLFFWNDWKKPYKYLYLFLFSILIATLALYLISYFAGIDAVINWELKSTFDSIKVAVDQFTRSLFNYSVDANNYLIREKYFASDIQANPLYSYAYFSLVMLGMLIALTVITRLELAWFAIGMGVFIFFLVYLHTEFLGIFGSSSKNFALLTIILYGGISFYFQAYDKKFSFLQRFLTFGALTIILATIIAYGAKTENPFLYIANYGLVVPVILTILFIISIAFDIIGGFLFITSGSRATGKNMILHFSIISILYIVNLLLIYLKKKGIIIGGFIYIDVFIIYLASAVIGIWGLKKRAPLFQNIIHVSHASFLYIALAIISTATITYSFITGNDPLTETFEYAILYSHLGIGLVFFLYILYNFWELFYKNISAYELMYEPRRMPFFMVRPLGLVIMLSLFMQSGMFAYKLAKAGYYNSIGDVYLYEGKLEEAKDAYKEGSVFGAMNRRSNYSMGTVLTKLNNKQQAAEYYVKSLEKYPSEYAYANVSNIYMENDQFFHAFFALKEGLQKFPESGPLHNNIALLYSSKGIWDSTLYHLQEAKNHLKNNEIVSSNFLWFLARKELYKEADSILKIKNFENYLPFQNNQIAIYNLNNKAFDKKLNEYFLKDSILTGKTYSYLFNYGINKAKPGDASVIEKINTYLTYEGNIDYHDELSFLKSLILYYSGKRAEAIKELRNLVLRASSESAIYYNKVLGLWAMEQEAYLLAAKHFQDAITLLDPETQLNKAVALLEAGNFNEGLEIINQLKNTPNKDVQKIAKNLILVFNTQDINEVKKWTEDLKFQFLHFRRSQLPESVLLEVYQTFNSEQFKILVAAELMNYYLEKESPQKAEEIWNNQSELTKNKNAENSFATGELNYQFLKLLEAKQDWKALSSAATTISLNEPHEPNRVYFLAISEENLGMEKEAEIHYTTALQRAPYHADAYIKAAEFYNKKNNPTKGYNILVEGIALNDNSAKLLMAYALQSLKINMESYAEESLDSIKELTTPQEFASFMKEYEREKAMAEKQFQSF